MGIQITLEEIDQVLILRLDGRLDAATAVVLERKLAPLIEEGKHLRIALDCANIDYLSSAGMRVLLAMNKKMHTKQGVLLLFSLSGEVEEILKMAGFDRVFRIFSNEKEVLQFKK